MTVGFHVVLDYVLRRFLFFALFSIVSKGDGQFVGGTDPKSLSQVGKTSAFVGPIVSSAIIDNSGGNVNMSFTFLFSV